MLHETCRWKGSGPGLGCAGTIPGFRRLSAACPSSVEPFRAAPSAAEARSKHLPSRYIRYISMSTNRNNKVDTMSGHGLTDDKMSMTYWSPLA